MSMQDDDVAEILGRVNSETVGAFRAFLTDRMGMDSRESGDLAWVLFQASEGVVHALAFGQGPVSDTRALRLLSSLCASYVKERLLL